MKKYFLYIITLLFISCDSLNELDEVFSEEYNYYDLVKFGWGEFLLGEYDLAIRWFEEALLINDIDEDGIEDNMHQSAYVGISWSMTYDFIQNDLSENNDLESYDLLDNAIKVMCYYIDSQNEWNLEGNCVDFNLISTSDSNALQLYSSSTNQTGIIFCEENYCCDDCFIKDKEVAFIYYYAYKHYYYGLIDDAINANLFYDKAIASGLDFLNNNNDYDFELGKPDNEDLPSFYLKKNNIIALMAQLYLRNNQYQDAASILYNANLCNDTINDLDNINIQSIIDCIDSFTL